MSPSPATWAEAVRGQQPPVSSPPLPPPAARLLQLYKECVARGTWARLVFETNGGEEEFFISCGAINSSSGVFQQQQRSHQQQQRSRQQQQRSLHRQGKPRPANERRRERAKRRRRDWVDRRKAAESTAAAESCGYLYVIIYTKNSYTYLSQN